MHHYRLGHLGLVLLLLAGGCSPAAVSDAADRTGEALEFLRANTLYGGARRGEIDRAMPVIGVVRSPTGEMVEPFKLHEAVRWWLGELNAELGRYDEALRYFSAFGTDPYAQLAMARIHQKRGDLRAARAAYAYCAEAWKDADAGFPPLAEAKVSLDRLAGEFAR